MILKAAPSSQRTKVPLPQSSKAPSTAASGSTEAPGYSEDEPLFMKPKQNSNRKGPSSRQRGLHKGFTLMGWQNPVMLWANHLEKQVRSFTHPSTSIHQYSCDRERWHGQNCKPSALRTWLLRMEEHSFYLFTIKCVTSVSMTSRSSLSSKDREKALANVLGSRKGHAR